MTKSEILPVEQVQSKDANSYDEVPYTSHAYPQSSASHLNMIAKLFDMDVPDHKNARILELGCASGGNLIPFAANFPDATFVGVDLSEKQIAEGNTKIKHANLSNVTLLHKSITDIDKAFGTFDYIISHGVLSWVPENVQEKMLEICGTNLADNGLAYISYNTLPGWNMVQTIRDMMLYHTSAINDPKEKAVQARLLLNFVKEGLGSNTNAYAKFIEDEISILSKQGDYYLLHDHMEENNQAFYFNELMERAGKYGLSYVGDTDVRTMFTGNLPKNVTSLLGQIQNDIVRTEQYVDFITNRRFRSTILCKKEMDVDRNLSGERLNDVFISTEFVPGEGFDRAALKEGEEVKFSVPKNDTRSFKTANVTTSLVIDVLSQSDKPLQTQELVKHVLDALGDNVKNKDNATSQVKILLLRLFLSGVITLNSEEGHYVTKLSTKPKVSDYARYQLTKDIRVTTQRYSTISFDLFGRMLVQYVDGTRTKAQLVKKMLEHFDKGEITLKEGSDAVTDKKKEKEYIQKAIDSSLKILLKNALLVS